MKPTRTRGTYTSEDYREEHPAYGVIGASRVSATPGAHLYGSDFRHRHYVVVRIAHSSLSHGLSSDHANSGDPIVEVALSEAQWATFVSAMNMGNGTACTIQRLGFTEVPDVEPLEDRRSRYSAEVDDALNEALDALAELQTAAPTKKLRDQVQLAIKKLTDSLPFIAQRYAEHAEATTEKAKIEVNAYITQAIQRAGMAAIGAASNPIELETEEES
jgi:hypothetical protein